MERSKLERWCVLYTGWFSLQSLCVVLVPFLAGVSRLPAQDPTPTIAKPEASDRETIWSKYLAQEIDGIAEYRIPDGSRVDVVTDTTAWEVEWPEKWAEAVGQSLLYSAGSNRKPGIVLLMGRRKATAEVVYYLRCLSVCNKAGITLMVVRVDQ